MSTQIIGNANQVEQVEVETNTRAARSTIRTDDWGTLGVYASGSQSGIMAAGLVAASAIFAFRWGDATRLAVLRKVIISAGNGGTAFTAGTATFNMFIQRSYSASDSGGLALTPGPLRVLMSPSAATDVRIATTAALTAGTRTQDANPVGSVTTGITTGGIWALAPTPLFEARMGEQPIVFAQNEGFTIAATVPATGTWGFGLNALWEEVTAY